ncbi:hypothetical protein [Polynucleobacter corsicus]|uniref:hypothetical protein n=1 Tax=Polynucleobacter corsicus TaxID=2081042 RepID=UPI001BFDB575|nr:hypothetical protein [Polynucleobacter corsicus]QWE18381.1 hypothetical protein C2747_08810 [Polynucleobacter corsicus]
MFKKLVLASLIAFVFTKPYAQITVDTTGGTTGGAVTSSPLSNSVSSVGSLSTGASTSAGGAGGSVGSLTTGASTSAGGAGGSVGNLTTGASTSTGGSVGSLTTGASTSAGGAGGSIGNLTTGASTSAGGSVGNTTSGASSSQGNTSGNTTITSTYVAPKIPVATAFSPANHPTAPCMGSTSIGGTAVLFGFSAGSSWEATECMTFEAARSFDQAGMHEDALAIKCTSKYSAAAPSCIRLRQQYERELQKTQSAQYEKPQQLVSVNLLGTYTETIDPVTGYKTIIDTRGTLPRAIINK